MARHNANNIDIMNAINKRRAYTASEEVLLMQVEREIYFDDKKGLYRLYYNGISVTGKTKEACLNNLCKKIEQTTVYTFENVHAAALAFDVSEGDVKPLSANRENEDWVKYVPNSIRQKSIVTCTAKELRKFFKSISAGRKMDVKRYNAVKTAFNRTYRYAIDQEYINHDLMVDLALKPKFKQPSTKKSEDMIYTKDEVPVLIKFCKARYLQTGTEANLAVALGLSIGTRVGETGALYFEDFSAKTGKVNISREVSKENGKTYEIVGHTKTHENREVPVNAQAKEIINMLPHRAGLLFHNKKGGVLTVAAVDRVLRDFAEYIGAKKVKNSHALRRTYASALYHKGVKIKKIQEYLGHKDEITTRGYIYDFAPNEDEFVNPFD